MRPVPWLVSFGIDEGQIDAEHRSMINLCNELCFAAATDPSQARHKLAQEDVAALLAHHFSTEERVFDDIAFPDSHLHRREHDHLRRLVSPLLSAPHETQFLGALLHARTGLVEHIIRHDLGFKSHLLHRDGR
ncbi:hemerythrin family protein [Magnetospirillum sp. J10]|uniref:Hemerythrin family protein n=1 Tax=Magnetospirillum sulfuroxidans TaxID=611300 RepID=A0ABS5I9A2_9PROT|nr:hemerythrin family protein [Magnetospirillum sulfuroxidans]